MDSFISLLLVVLISLACRCVGQRKDYEKEGKLSFLAVGDAGGLAYAPYYTKNLENVAEQMGKIAKKTHAKFVIGLGDNFYWNGVKNVSDFRFRATFENIFRAPSLYRTKWYMLAGNHDYKGNVSAQIAYTKVSRRWSFPDFYYTTVHKIPGSCKTVQIVTIDTTLLCYKSGGIYPGKQRQQYHWINEILKNSNADYLVVAGHHPVYSIGMHGSNACLNEKIKPLLEKYDVTAYLSGHDHNMQYIKPLDSKVHYFVSGSASNHNQLQYNKIKVPPNSIRFFNGKIGGFTLLQATPQHLTVSFISSNGKRLSTSRISPRRKRSCSRKTKAPFVIENFEDSVLDAFFGLQEENELRKRQKHTGMNG